MEKPSGLGIWSSTNILNKEELADLACQVEDRGYQTLWYPESLSYESLALGGYLLSKTSKLLIGSGISNIYARDAVTAAQGHDSLNQIYGNRFIMGLGVSHVPLVSGARGHQYGKPVATMKKYLDDMGSAAVDPSIRLEDRSIVLAALGPKMLELASTATKGSLPYCVTPDHTLESRKLMGPDAWLCVEQKICLTNDRGVGRGIARKQMARYMSLENYRNNWLRLGFTEEEVSGEGADRFIDAMVVCGSERIIQDCIESHFKSGANQVVLQAFRPDGGMGIDLKALAAFSPGR
tara:strand:- start:846 stop:1724 length:879 start_codon:yes stop_codon:yes gene_type:complete